MGLLNGMWQMYFYGRGVAWLMESEIVRSELFLMRTHLRPTKELVLRSPTAMLLVFLKSKLEEGNHGPARATLLGDLRARQAYSLKWVIEFEGDLGNMRILKSLMRVFHFSGHATLHNSRTQYDVNPISITHPSFNLTRYRKAKTDTSRGNNAIRLQRCCMANDPCTHLSHNRICVSRSRTEVTKIISDQSLVRAEFQCLLHRSRVRQSDFVSEWNDCV
ncbi:hypothetical protein VNO77_38938 [Canavalia gladiata]|uniref:Uncharacterized protein n=1 Tax=Canavalia gladiata TaxID=3824 RepID=A0AAN9PZ93_CANGL